MGTLAHRSNECRRRSPETCTRVSEQLVKRVKSEFIEMPGLRLTLEQGSRLWGLERDECDALLHSLVHRKFLTVTGAAKHGRATDGVARQGLAEIRRG